MGFLGKTMMKMASKMLEKRTIKNKHGNRIETYVPVRVEEWKGKYKNECCGKEYEDTWEHKIDLRD